MERKTMQDLSYNLNEPIFDFNGLRFGVQVFSFENVYSLDAQKCTISQYNGTYSIVCNGLTWAGGQETAEGSVVLTATKGDDCTRFEIEANLERTIRCVKLYFKDIPKGAIVNLRETRRKEIPSEGLNLRYPDGWRGLYTPLAALEAAPDSPAVNYFRSWDAQVREKRFVFLDRGDTLDVELIFEDAADKMSQSVKVPVWEVGQGADLTALLKEQTSHISQVYELVPWEQRPDVPGWAQDISLVAAVHCQHFTGYVFNDYPKVIENLKWLAQHIEPRRVLVYLPGWEGRYYWQYGAYRPDPRMGGHVGFKQLVDTAREMGFHLMPMFGINFANRGLENFEQWGAPALTSPAGGVPPNGSVDWDGSRHYDHAWGALLNPGAASWQNRLVEQITGLIEKYGFDGVFLDISAVWLNDPRCNTYDGIVELCRRIREKHPEVLIAGEGWYDGIGLATPLVQSGHTDGVLHWHDEPYSPLFDTYQRSFAHLCLGDPGRGSTGVHELGTNPIRRTPLRKGVIPTVTLVEDTLRVNPDGVLQIIEDARAYADLYTGAVLKAE
jgi:hypothetical protein